MVKRNFLTRTPTASVHLFATRWRHRLLLWYLRNSLLLKWLLRERKSSSKSGNVASDHVGCRCGSASKKTAKRSRFRWERVSCKFMIQIWVKMISWSFVIRKLDSCWIKGKAIFIETFLSSVADLFSFYFHDDVSVLLCHITHFVVLVKALKAPENLKVCEATHENSCWVSTFVFDKKENHPAWATAEEETVVVISVVTLVVTY